MEALREDDNVRTDRNEWGEIGADDGMKIAEKTDNFFFFSSRRRHTRYWRDWSSDVCSSDLGNFFALLGLSKKYF